MGVLAGNEPEKVFEFFEQICSIPHGSTNVKEISDYLVEFAKERGLKYRQDEKYNVIIWKDGTQRYENSEPVILQGHIDMVAVKTDDCDKDLEKEGLDLEIVEGDYISAKGTSLGGDDGIAVAYSLAILDSNDICHPPIEAVFTTDEEIGMLGADFIDVSDLKGKIFMNMDSEDEGVFTVSCAGGATATCILPNKKEPISASAIKIRLDGLTGGHSGVEIIKGRLNANVAMGRILLNVFQKFGMRLITINGGEKDNAIATYCEAAIAVLPQTVEGVKKLVLEVFDELKEEYKVTDPAIEIKIDEEEEKLLEALGDASTLATVISLVNMPTGIQRMNPEIEGLPQTSLNLGILKEDEEGVKLSYSVRSSSETEKRFLIEKLRSMTEIFGGKIEIVGDYPGWEYKSDSKLRDVMVETYQSLYGCEPVVEGIHAGLECGIFASKIPELDAVSFGPQMQNIHTTNEVLSISSTERTWKLVLETLKRLK